MGAPVWRPRSSPLIEGRQASLFEDGFVLAEEIGQILKHLGGFRTPQGIDRTPVVAPFDL